MSLYDQGNSLEKQGKHEESIKYYDESIRLNPKYGVAFINRSILLTALERFDEANESYNKGIE